ncbi:MAG: hypothetical protein R2801_05940 [Chitinophagales bacterium]
MNQVGLQASVLDNNHKNVPSIGNPTKVLPNPQERIIQAIVALLKLNIFPMMIANAIQRKRLSTQEAIGNTTLELSSKKKEF